MKTHKTRNHDGEAKFWRSPELVRTLLPYLEVGSTMALASTHPLTVALLQNMFIWRDFIQRTKMKRGSKFREVEGRKSFEMEVMEVELKQVVAIINLAEEPKPFLLELVHAICKRFSSITGVMDEDEDDRTIQLSCEELPSHAVTPSGFLLLRQAESLAGLLVHKVERVEKCFHAAFSGISGSLLTSVASLATMQEVPLLSLELFHMNCNTREESLARITLLQRCRNWSVSFLDVKSQSLGAEGWSGLATAVLRGSIVCLSTSREVVAEGRREDLKLVWEASTRWNVDGRWIAREVFWIEDEADTKIGWEMIEDLLWNSPVPPCIEGHDQDLSDVTLARKAGLEADAEEEEEESSEEELERSLAAEAYEQALAEEPAVKATKILFSKDNIHSTGYKHRKCWKFCRSSGRIKLWKKAWKPCCKKEKLSLANLRVYI